MKKSFSKSMLLILLFILILPILYYRYMFGGVRLSPKKDDMTFFYEYFNNILTPLLSLFAGVVVYLTYQNQIKANKIQNLSSLYEYFKALLSDLEKWMEASSMNITSHAFSSPSARISEINIHEDFGDFRIYFTSVLTDSKIAIQKFETIESSLKNHSPDNGIPFNLELFKLQLSSILNSFEAYQQALIKMKNLINDKERSSFDLESKFIKVEKTKWLIQIEETRVKVSDILKVYKYTAK